MWTWDDLWRVVRESRDDGPRVLSETAARAALGVAIGRAAAAGRLSTTAEVSSWPGFRRRILDRIGGWIRAERALDGEVPDEEPTAADEWAIYGGYVSLLAEIGACDFDGLVSWASRALNELSPAVVGRLGTVTVLDLEPGQESPAVRRALIWLEENAKSVRVTLTHDADPARKDVFAASAGLRGRLLGRGYVEEIVRVDAVRPSALARVEERLFHPDGFRMNPITNATGVALRGAPQGEGLGLVVAREVSELIHKGADPEEILVLARRWDEDADLVVETLQSWAIPTLAVGRPSRAATEPGVSALRLALRVAADGWETSGLISLLRHGRFRPDWVEYVGQPVDLAARAAALVRSGRVFRGKSAIRRSITAVESPDDSGRSRESRAGDLAERLIAELSPLERRGPWDEHLGRLKRVSASLGFDRDSQGSPDSDDALAGFLDALADHAAVLNAAGLGAESVSARDFLREVDSIADSLTETSPSRPGGVVVTTVDAAAGARARFVLMVNLSEGSFPSRDSVGPADDTGIGPAFAREMTRFLGVIGSASERLILVFPTRDEKGQVVLPAGFLEDLIRLFEPRAIEAASRVVQRFDPALIDSPELAAAPADARVRATALACLRNDTGLLRRLASDSLHRAALFGTADALNLGRERFQVRAFTRFDGLLTDPATPVALARRFGAGYTFSPSQLETYVECPFKFFLRYVVGVAPVDDRDDIDEDFAGRGERIHRALELLEQMYAQQGGERLELATMVIKTEMAVELSTASETDPGRQLIENERLGRTLKQYVGQASAYEQKHGRADPSASHQEVVFGETDRDGSLPILEIGEGPGVVKVRGKIDRVDVVSTDDGLTFRVIDYKSGSSPGKADVTGAVALQLPLYAMAVERFLMDGGAVKLRDLGYWSLKTKGYDPVKLPDWDELREKVVATVLEEVAALRAGRFVIEPLKDDCTRTCDYRVACRVAQVRGTGKGRVQNQPGEAL